jgi:N-acetylmuramoyl-L-alanine amidase
VIAAPSPNFGPRRDGARPDMVVLHHTAMATAEAALARLRDPGAEVSAHYLVAEDGRVWRMVDEEMRAWHAGAGAWGDARDVNSRSIGIELANPGDAPHAARQMAALEALLADILRRRAIPPERVIGHGCMAPGRKTDPGRAFDWRRLARGGLSVWLDAPGRGAPADPARFAAAAAAFGYPGGDAATLAAFRRRFRPGEDEAAPLTGADVAHLEALAARWPVAPGAAVA